MRMDREQSCLCVIDVQERLAAVMHDMEPVARNCALLMQAASRLSVPTLVSEQYPKGLGSTVADLQPLFAPDDTIEKMTFSCSAEPAWRETFDDVGRAQAVLCGIETHVCVFQTAQDLLDAGTAVFVVADAVTSRTPFSKANALDRLRDNGAEVVTTEMVVFEWLRESGTEEFKEISKWIK